jgi:DNA repair protein RecO
MYKKHHTKGIIISGKAESKDSRRVDIFTEEFGLLSVRVQGARNIHSKLRFGVQNFSFGEYSMVHGRTGWRLVSARPEKNFFEIFRSSSDKIKIAGNILNLIKKLTSENSEAGSETSLFKVVSNFFDFLEKSEDKDIDLAECLTLMRILHSLGYMRHDPELMIPLSSSEILSEHLDTIAPRRSKIVSLINESLKAA